MQLGNVTAWMWVGLFLSIFWGHMCTLGAATGRRIRSDLSSSLDGCWDVRWRNGAYYGELEKDG